MQGIKFTTETFIAQAKNVHGDKYDYSLVKYRGAHSKVKIKCEKHGIFIQSASSHLKGYQCRQCTMEEKRHSLEHILQQFVTIHADKYDYSSVNYMGYMVPVEITCKKHRYTFMQSPANHIKGEGCTLCGNEAIAKSKSKGIETFIAEAIIVHGSKYDYSKTEYKNTKTGVEIICSTHGSFFQTPLAHLRGNGCLRCGKEGAAKKRTSNTTEFIRKSIQVHGDRYDYSLSIYEKAQQPIIIICKQHGSFSQTPNSHLSGHGCNQCATVLISEKLSSSTDEFVKLANEIHSEKYDYSEVEYKGSYNVVKITCPTHGIFSQSPTKHLQGGGCHKCARIISKLEIEWLDFLLVPEKYRQQKITVNGRTYKLDAYNPNTNTIYEFYGDFWHGNPLKFNPKDANKANHKLFGELYQKTISREAELKVQGYIVVSIWEADWNKIKLGLTQHSK